MSKVALHHPSHQSIILHICEITALARFCKQGFDDARRFLQQRGLTTSSLSLTVESCYHLGTNTTFLNEIYIRSLPEKLHLA